MVTDLNYHPVCMCVCVLCILCEYACVAFWEPSPSAFGDDVTGALQCTSEGENDRTERWGWGGAVVFSHLIG